MSTTSSPNPLRPYFIPRDPLDNFKPNSNLSATPAHDVFGSSSLDYDSYLDTASTKDLISAWANDLSMSYLTCIIGQPFETAKTILQVQYRAKGVQGAKDEDFDDAGSNASDDSSDPEYFAPTSPPLSPSRNAKSNPKRTDRAGYVLEADAGRAPWQLHLPKESVRSVLGAMWRKDGVWGVWRGTNATFIYTFLQSTLQSWTASLLSAVFTLPDPAITEIADSIHPMASLGLVVTSCAVTALLLSPLDIIRTRLMVTPSEETTRNIVPHFHSLPSWYCPPSLIIPTTLHAIIPSFITNGFPLFLRSQFSVDPLFNPGLFTMGSFLGETVELFALLPVETVLRRGQVQATNPKRTLVTVGHYYGTLPTMWHVARNESTSSWGVDGLYRGWKIGMWGICGKMGIGLLGFGQANESVESEF